MPRRTLKTEKELIPVTREVENAPVVDLDKALPNTYYRKRNDGGYAFTTIMPTGLYVGWDTCGGCHLYMTLCRCTKGITAPNSVVHIYDMAEQRIKDGISKRVVEVDKTSKNPSTLVPPVPVQGQVSAPDGSGTGTAESKPRAVRKLKRMKRQ